VIGRRSQAIARRRQTVNLSVAEHFLARWFRNHADSHDSTIWQQRNIREPWA